MNIEQLAQGDYMTALGTSQTHKTLEHSSDATTTQSLPACK